MRRARIIWLKHRQRVWKARADRSVYRALHINRRSKLVHNKLEQLHSKAGNIT